MNRKLRGIFLLLLGMLFVQACDKKTTDPKTTQALSIKLLESSVPLSSAEVCGSMYSNVLQLVSGTTLTMKLEFKGSENLSQYKIDIHNNFDCHGHQRPAGIWEYLQVKDIDGKSVTVTEHIPLPDEAFSGNYHCIIRLIDELGNEAEFLDFNLIVSNAEDSEAPVINYILPATDSIALYKGDLLTFKGTVTDNNSLKGGKLEIKFVDADNKDYSAINENFPQSDITTHAFDRDYVIPNYIATGTAVFTLKAFDKFNNSSERKVKVHVLN